MILIITSILAYFIGVLSPILANNFIPQAYGIELKPAFSFLSYLNIAFIGLLVVLIFSIPSLYSISSIKAVALFRNTFQPVSLHFSTKNIIYLFILTSVLVIYFVLQTQQQFFTLMYFLAFFATIFIFYGSIKIIDILFEEIF